MLRDYDPDIAIFWLEGKTLETTQVSCQRIASKLDIVIDGQRNTDILRIFKCYLESKESGRWLVVIDDVTSVESISRVIPARTNGALLLTARSPGLFEGYFRDIKVFELPDLSQEESEDLLASLLGDYNAISDHDKTRIVTQLLDASPSGLSRLAGLSASLSISTPRFLDIYRVSEWRLQPKTDLPGSHQSLRPSVADDLAAPLDSLELVDQLVDGHVLSQFPIGNVQDFIPNDHVEKLITAASITQAMLADGRLQDDAPDHHTLDDQERDLVDFVFTKAKRIFAICILCDIPQRRLKSAMESFKSQGIGDKHLPFSSEDFIESHAPVKSWTRIQKWNLSRYQWRLLCPVFPKGFTKMSLSPEHILPFTYVSSQSKGGTFGEVYKVAIHRSHQEQPVRKVRFYSSSYGMARKFTCYHILMCFIPDTKEISSMAPWPTSRLKR